MDSELAGWVSLFLAALFVRGLVRRWIAIRWRAGQLDDQRAKHALVAITFGPQLVVLAMIVLLVPLPWNLVAAGVLVLLTIPWIGLALATFDYVRKHVYQRDVPH